MNTYLLILVATVIIVIPLAALGLPALEMCFSVIGRAIGGRSLFDRDPEYIHHKQLVRGCSQRCLALVLYGVCVLFGVLALSLTNNTRMRMAGLLVLVIGIAVLFVAGRTHFEQVDEVGVELKRNLGERRLRIANNIRVRRASRIISRATTLSEIFGAMPELLEAGEFVYANAQLGRNEAAARNGPIPGNEEQTLQLRHAEMHGGLINWSWERGDIRAEEIIGSSHFWTLRLPITTRQAEWGYLNLYRELGEDALLLDINYLCDLFQRELAQAAERVLSANYSSEKDTLPMPLLAFEDIEFTSAGDEINLAPSVL